MICDEWSHNVTYVPVCGWVVGCVCGCARVFFSSVRWCCNVPQLKTIRIVCTTKPIRIVGTYEHYYSASTGTYVRTYVLLGGKSGCFSPHVLVVLLQRRYHQQC